MANVSVEIITIGDEILIGQIVDTNSAWMGAELSKAGFDVVQITSVHDDARQIKASLQSALGRADAVLVTGGIGPTKDDITKQTLCDFFGTHLVFDEAVYRNIQQLYVHRKDVINELTRAQAMVPESAVVIQNAVGTAPITWFEREGRVVVSMPGVPYEMKQAMSSEIIPRLVRTFHAPAVLHKTLIVTGYPESALALKIAGWENALPQNMHLAYLPNFGIVRLRLSGMGEDAFALDTAMCQQVEQLKVVLGEAVVCDEDLTAAQWLGRVLTAGGLTLAAAESCTGGNIAHRVTEVPGSSAYFKGAVVAYANEVKTGVLGVRTEDIERHGAVSREVVEQMAEGVRRVLKTDWAVATSGIMGPDGGTPDKPVGTVWMAVASAEKTVSRVWHMNLRREQNIERTTQTALLMLRELL